MIAAEVTRPDGSRFVSMSADLDRLGAVYPASGGYKTRLVRGEVTRYGFRIEEEVESHA